MASLRDLVASIRGRITKKRGFIIAVVVILFLVIRGNVANSSIPKVTAQKAQMGNIVETISASGKVDADKKALLSFQSGGKLAYVGVTEGESVAKGKVLARLDTTSLWSAYQQATYNLRSAQAALDNTYDQVKGHASDESFTQRQTRTTAEVARDNAFQAMVAAQNALSNASLVSPIDGIVSKVVPDEVGINVTASGSAYEVFNPESLYFSVEVNEIDLPKLKTDGKVTLNFDAFPDKQVTGKVDRIGYASIQTSTGGTAYKIRVTIDDAFPQLRLGMNGDANFYINEVKDVLAVPSTAIVDDGSKRYVWKVTGGVATEVEVKLGVESIDLVQITQGIGSGDEVILTPPVGLKSGDRVNVTVK